jgi:membrane protease YdiL (CAAX protease family)
VKTLEEFETGREVSAAQSPLRAVFVGAEGIRSGWSVLLFVAIMVVQAMVTRIPVDRLLHHLNHTPGLEMWSPIVGAAFPALLVVVATALMARIERRPVLSYGFVDARWLSRFALGLTAGVGALSVLVLALKLSGFLVFDAQALHGWTALRCGLQWGLAFLLTGIFEESLLRGYLQSTLARGLGFWWAALLLSVAFGAAHIPNHGESPIGILSVVCAGMMFCLSLWLTRSLYWAVGLHAGWDWAQTYLYGVADSGEVDRWHLFSTHACGSPLLSGGQTGPEGSIYMLPIVAAITLGLWLAWRNRDPALTVV